MLPNPLKVSTPVVRLAVILLFSVWAVLYAAMSHAQTSDEFWLAPPEVTQGHAGSTPDFRATICWLRPSRCYDLHAGQCCRLQWGCTDRGKPIAKPVADDQHERLREHSRNAACQHRSRTLDSKFLRQPISRRSTK